MQSVAVQLHSKLYSLTGRASVWVAGMPGFGVPPRQTCCPAGAGRVLTQTDALLNFRIRCPPETMGV